MIRKHYEALTRKKFPFVNTEKMKTLLETKQDSRDISDLREKRKKEMSRL